MQSGMVNVTCFSLLAPYPLTEREFKFDLLDGSQLPPYLSDQILKSMSMDKDSGRMFGDWDRSRHVELSSGPWVRPNLVHPQPEGLRIALSAMQIR